MKTEKVYIQHLMEKFMDNATSVDEERVLKEYMMIFPRTGARTLVCSEDSV